MSARLIVEYHLVIMASVCLFALRFSSSKLLPAVLRALSPGTRAQRLTLCLPTKHNDFEVKL